MTAEERLDTAMRETGRGKGYDWFPIAADVFLADPHLAQDLADGAALRQLRDAVVGHLVMVVKPDDEGWQVACMQSGVADASTFAKAADICREALR